MTLKTIFGNLFALALMSSVYYFIATSQPTKEMALTLCYLLAINVLINLIYIVKRKLWKDLVKLLKSVLVKILLLAIILPVAISLEHAFNLPIINFVLAFPMLYETFEIDSYLRKFGINVLEYIHKLTGRAKEYSKEIKELKNVYEENNK